MSLLTLLAPGVGMGGGTAAVVVPADQHPLIRGIAGNRTTLRGIEGMRVALRGSEGNRTVLKGDL